MGAIQIYEKATGQVTPMERFQGDLANAMPVYQDGDRYQPIKAELVATFLNQMEAYRQGAIALESFQRTQQYVLENSQKAHAESLAIVERMSDRALFSAENTIAHQRQTIDALASAVAAKSNASSNVSVKVETTGGYIDYEWLAWGVLFASIMGMTLVLSANIFQGSRQYQPQSALPPIEVRSL